MSSLDTFRPAAKSQQGSALLFVLLAFMIVLVIAGTVMEIVFIENRVSTGSSDEGIARQAADAGIAVARDVIMNYLAAGESPPALEDIYLHNGCRAHITYDLSEISEGRAVITSRGFAEDGNGKILAARAAVACIQVGYLPDYTVRAGELKLMGKYLATVAAQPVSGLGEQDWDADPSTFDSRLEDDPENPEYYPQNGRTFAYFLNQWQENHPGFYLFDHIWSGIPNADVSWRIAYQNEGDAPDQGEDDAETDRSHVIGESSLNVFPFYVPRGYVEFLNADGSSARLGVEKGWNNRLDPAEMGNLFDDHLPVPRWGEWLSEEYYQSEVVRALYNTRARMYLPEKKLISMDFLKKGEMVTNIPPFPGVTENINRFRQLARLDPGWQYLGSDSSALQWNSDKYEMVIDNLEQTCIFIDCSAGDTIFVNYNKVLSSPAAVPIQEWLEGDKGTFFEQIQNQHKNVLIVSPANLELHIDPRMFNSLRSDLWFYIISSGSITLNLEPAPGGDSASPCQNIRALIMAGQNLHINSFLGNSRLSGLLSAGHEMTISVCQSSSLEENGEETVFQIYQDEYVVDGFPEKWSYLGMGAISAYDYIH